jgi:hypothetical protein
MWDTFQLSAVGNFSLRKIALLLMAGIMSAVFMVIANSPTTFAENASWSGDSLTYNSHTYTKETAALPGIQPGWDAYVYKPTDQSDKAFVIAVRTDSDKTKEITDAELRQYTLEGGNSYSSPGPPTKITVTAQVADGTSATTNKTSCDVQGIGWIVCGTSRFIAGAMDRVYGWISGFLTVKPLTTDTSSGLFQAWEITRGLANACFIAAFLIIIYSQITSVGISNYEIKKMIPRLIIAAILVNVSYYICAVAVDISNILGDSVQSALMQIRNSLPAPFPEGDWWRSWSSFSEVILSGGTIGATAGILAMTGGATGGAISALAALLVPVLVAGILSVLVALLVLAARQALITVLIVISPLAFVAFLLPNTEKYFDKWRGLLMTMLLVFPMFSLLFGASQLASYIIIQSTNQLSVVILALFVQVAPLALTPFLVRFSGTLLGKLSSMVNNPQKGLVDRSRNWANERAKAAAERGRVKGETSRNPIGMRRIAYRRAMGKRNREGLTKLRESQLNASFAETERAKLQMVQSKDAELRQGAATAIGEHQFELTKAGNARLLNYSGTQRAAQSGVKALQADDEARWEEAHSNLIQPGMNHRYAEQSTDAKAALRAQHIAEGQKEAATTMHTQEYVAHLQTDPSLRAAVGGINPKGAEIAAAKAKAADVEYKAKTVKQIQDASPIMPGKTMEMADALIKAINDGKAEEARAHINMLAESNDPGVIAARQVLMDHESKMIETGIIDEVKFHINNHPSLNTDAEDIVAWSRNDETLRAINADARTYSSLSASKFMAQKKSTQLDAIASGGISKATMRDILINPGKVNIKAPVLTKMREKLKIDRDGNDDLKLSDPNYKLPD